MYYRSDSNNPDPDNPPSASSRTAIIPQIQFDGDLMEPCSGAPFAGIITDAMEVCGGSEISVTANGATSGFSGLIYQWQKREGSTGDWTNVDGANARTLAIVAPNTDTEYRFSVTCDGNTDYSNSLILTIKPAADCFCTPGGTSSYHITDFSTTGGIENISNLASGNSAGGYGDFSDKVVSQELGESVSFTAVTNGTTTAGFRIWVDWNQNGVFEESEIMFSSSAYANTHNGSFAVPVDALEGETRMRVVNHYLSSVGNVDPCATNHTYGEFEDYTFDVIHPSCYRPADLTANNITPYTAELSWSQIGTVGEWEIEWGIGNDLVLGMGTNETVTSSTHLLQNLNSDTDYSYYVRAICGVGDESNWSGPYSFRTQVSCPQPIDLEVTNITPFTADLSWVEDGTATEWEIEWGEGSFVQGMGTNVDVSATTYQLQGLTSDTDHRFYVRAKCGVGDESVWSGPSDFRTEISCFAPVDVNVSDLTTTTAKINWTEPDQLPDGYELYISELNLAPSAFDIADYTATAGTTSIDLSGLSDNTQYYYWIRSSCTANDYSSFVSGSFRTTCLPAVAPFTEGFEGGTANTNLLPSLSCWSEEFVEGTTMWKLVSSGGNNGSISPNEGSLFAEFKVSNRTHKTKLVSPQIDLSSLNSPQLSFYLANVAWGSDIDELRVYYKNDISDASWTLIPGAEYTTQHASWEQIELGLPNSVGATNYVIAFEAKSDWGYGVNLDNISIHEGPDCSRPTTLQVSNIT
ncbi:MAG: fibronectin type III domain-containing protein, partial [Bacteroidales bacterium]|nr:fibronectin type III domain-containing protein [Bacteroidales bacterium]